ncbi:hypothetical protein GOBAR_AA38143 [Gossypium barbadense]|uniref:Uncharacterized protein n=1 Tax=Gossypium barbadense TaxID=3634 RepID=A0A2P5VUQ5_GOSBA|nr:hypothetical protein GOBAR_AA38143 [Gossypium barbadense]
MSRAANDDQRYMERVPSTLFLNGFEVGTLTTTATQGKREDPSAPRPLPRPLVEPQGVTAIRSAKGHRSAPKWRIEGYGCVRRMEGAYAGGGARGGHWLAECAAEA